MSIEFTDQDYRDIGDPNRLLSWQDIFSGIL